MKPPRPSHSHLGFLVTLFLTGSIGSSALFAQTRGEVDVKEFGGHSYQIVLEVGNWTQAQQGVAARPFGRCGVGHLATITSQEENVFLQNLVDSVERLWIGLERADSGSPWTWVTGEAFDYDNWAVNEPSGDGDKADMWGSGALLGQWKDESASNGEVSGYIIEWDQPLCDLEIVEPGFTVVNFFQGTSLTNLVGLTCDLAFSPDGTVAYVTHGCEGTNAGAQSAAVVRAATGEVTGFGPFSPLFDEAFIDAGLVQPPGTATFLFWIAGQGIGPTTDRGTDGAHCSHGIQLL